MIIGSFGATRPVFGNLLGNLDSPNCPDVQLIQMLLKSWPIPSIFIRCLFSNVISSIINEIIIKVVDRRSKRPNLSNFLFRCVWGQLGLSELPQKYFLQIKWYHSVWIWFWRVFMHLTRIKNAFDDISDINGDNPILVQSVRILWKIFSGKFGRDFFGN